MTEDDKRNISLPSWPRLAVILVLLSVMVAGGIVVPSSSSQVEASVSDAELARLQEAIREQEREQQRLEQEIREAERQVQQYQQQENALLRELARMEAQLQSTINERRRLDQRLAAIAHELALTEAELQNAEIELEHRTDLMNRRVVATYKMGMVSYLEVLLDANSFGDFISRLELLRHIVQADVEIFEAVERARNEVAQRKTQIETLQAETQEVRSQVAAKEDEIRVQVAAQTRKAQEIRQNRQAAQSLLRQQEAASRQVERMLQDLQTQFARASGELRFMWPYDARVTSGYGWRTHPITRSRNFHTGIDIGAPYGAPVRASESGVVIFAGWMGGYGITVVIDHGRNLSSLYAHNSTLTVSSGQVVSRGQTIARVGTTGMSTGPHIHFEIRENGQHRNPMNYLP